MKLFTQLRILSFILDALNCASTLSDLNIFDVSAECLSALRGATCQAQVMETKTRFVQNDMDCEDIDSSGSQLYGMRMRGTF